MTDRSNLARLRRWVPTLLAATAAVVLLLGTTVASLIGLNAECTGSTADCPRSDAYRGALLGIPVAAALLLVGGAAWSIRRRTVRPLVLAEAGVLVVAALTDAVLDSPNAGTLVLLALAGLAVRSALRRT